jgi:hypothetical protein
MSGECRKILSQQGYDINTVGWRNTGQGCVPVDCDADYNTLWGTISMDVTGRQSYQPGCLDGKVSCLGKDCEKNLITSDPACLMTAKTVNPQASTNDWPPVIARLGKEWFEQPCCRPQPYTSIAKTWAPQERYTL